MNCFVSNFNFGKYRGNYRKTVSKIAGEHKVHPYFRSESLRRGESCIRPNLAIF
jgi:hypothetical protein